MPDVTISLTTPNALRVSNAIKGLWPIPKIADPDYTGDGEAPLVDQFTATVWAKKNIIKFLKRTVHRYENSVAKKAAEVAEDENIAT